MAALTDSFKAPGIARYRASVMALSSVDHQMKAQLLALYNARWLAHPCFLVVFVLPWYNALGKTGFGSTYRIRACASRFNTDS